MPKYEFDSERWLRNVAEVQSHRAGAGAAMLRENMLKCAEEIERLRARVVRLEEALPNPCKLEVLARWIDWNFENDPDPEVQTDLREWAKKIRRAMEHQYDE